MTSADQPSSPTETLALEFDLEHSPEKVWLALTTPELLAEWLLPIVGFRPEAGTAFSLQAPPQPSWDGTVHCRLVDVEPLRMIRYTWVVGDPDSDFFLDTLVTFTLTPTPSGTRLSLEHSGFKPDQRQNLSGARYGWKMMGGQLAELLVRIG